MIFAEDKLTKIVQFISAGRLNHNNFVNPNQRLHDEVTLFLIGNIAMVFCFDFGKKNEKLKT